MAHEEMEGRVAAEEERNRGLNKLGQVNSRESGEKGDVVHQEIKV